MSSRSLTLWQIAVLLVLAGGLSAPAQGMSAPGAWRKFPHDSAFIPQSSERKKERLYEHPDLDRV